MKVIITGATGMVGKGILLECLKNDKISEVLVIGRKSVEMNHGKLKEIVHKDFFNLESIKDELTGYDACFFSLGISSFRMNEEDYTRITYDLTMSFAKVLFSLNPTMVFNYISGAGTDGTEKGKSMWARVKGKTENDLRNLGFKGSYGFRPGLIKPERGLKTQTGIYKIFMPLARGLYPIVNLFAPNSAVDTGQIARAMIYVSENLPNMKVLEPRDINKYAH